MSPDRLRFDLADLAEEARPVDLRDRVLKTSRRLGIQRAVATSAAVVVMVGAATGTAFAIMPSNSGSGPAPADTPSATAPAPVLPSPSATGTPEESTSTTAAAVDDALRPTGIGPYAVGAEFAELRSRGLLTAAETNAACDWAGARGLAEYHEPYMSFYGGRLTSLSVDNPEARTAQGAGPGMTLAEIKERHPDGRLLTHESNVIQPTPSSTKRYAWFVVDGTYALLFRVDEAERVASIAAGRAQSLELQFTDGGEGC